MLIALLLASTVELCTGLQDAISQSEGAFAESGMLSGIACKIERHPTIPAKELRCKLHESPDVDAATAEYRALSAQIEECLGAGWGIHEQQGMDYTERHFQRGRIIVYVRHDHPRATEQAVWLKIWRILTKAR